MKKKIFCLTMAMLMLINCIGFTTSVKAANFTDVPETHWAIKYISGMQLLKIINGYEDGTFKPENQVTTGEFIKMLCMSMYPNFEYKAPSPDEEDGTHWSKPYVIALNRTILDASEYDDMIVSKTITREEAAKLICYFHMQMHASDNEKQKLNRDQSYIKDFTDESLVTDETSRILIDNCVRFGLINGFEDGTFRPNDGLTRAQAAKIIYTAMFNK